MAHWVTVPDGRWQRFKHRVYVALGARGWADWFANRWPVRTRQEQRIEVADMAPILKQAFGADRLRVLSEQHHPTLGWVTEYGPADKERS